MDPVNVPIEAADVTFEDIGESGDRPGGVRFGMLVHSVLSDVPLEGAAAGAGPAGDARAPDIVTRLASAHGRMLGADDREIAAAARIVRSALTHPLLKAAGRALARGSCFRETPITCRVDAGSLVEGTADLAFDDGDGFVVIARHRGVQSLGLLLALGTVCVLVASFTVLPGLLRLLAQRRRAPALAPRSWSPSGPRPIGIDGRARRTARREGGSSQAGPEGIGWARSSALRTPPGGPRGGARPPSD